VLDGWLAADAVTATDAERVAAMIGHDNACRVYGLVP
jgi:hypothetical protein